MIDEAPAQRHNFRRSPRRGLLYLLAVLLFGAAFAFVIQQSVRRCSDLAGTGQVLWGDLRPLGLPFVFFLIGLSLLGLRAVLLLRRDWQVAAGAQLPLEQPRNRQLILLSLAILSLFFGIIFLCSQLALMWYPPCSLEIAINPVATADYRPWSTDVFQPLDPKIGTQIALDAADEVVLVPAAHMPAMNIVVGVVEQVAQSGQATLPPEAVLATATAEAVAAIPTALSAQTQTTVAQTAVSSTAEALLTATSTMTGTLGATPTGTLSATPTATVTATLSATPLTTATAVLSQTTTATPTSTATGTLTSTATFTSTATSTATLIPTVFIPPTGAPVVPIPTALPTYTPTSTRTPTPTFTPAVSSTPTDTFTPTQTFTPTATNTPFGLGSIYREYWLGIPGNPVTQLTSSPNYPNSPNGCDLRSSFDAPINWADNYGTRMRGYLYPPTSGLYTFWIASDDYGELWLSADMNPLNRVLIANVAGWTNPQQWNKYASQQSAAIALTAGQGYYIDALQKEGGGLDTLSVAWQGPAISQAVIPGANLAPYQTTCTFIPTPTNTPTFTLTFTPTPTFTPTFTPTWTPVPSADLYVTMVVSNPAPNVGDTIQYNISYGNLGTSTATVVQMLSPLPIQVDYVSHTGGTFDSATGNWTLPDLISGQNGAASITVMVRPEASGLTVSNSIVIMSAVTDPNAGNNSANSAIAVP